MESTILSIFDVLKIWKIFLIFIPVLWCSLQFSSYFSCWSELSWVNFYLESWKRRILNIFKNDFAMLVFTTLLVFEYFILKILDIVRKAYCSYSLKSCPVFCYENVRNFEVIWLCLNLAFLANCFHCSIFFRKTDLVCV